MARTSDVSTVQSLNPGRLFSALIVLSALALLAYIGSRLTGPLQITTLLAVGLAILVAPFSSIIGAFALVAHKHWLAELFSQYYLLFRELTKLLLPNDFGLSGIALTNLAVLAVSQGRYLDAQELLTEPCTLKIDQALKLSLLGQICAFTGQADEAVAKLEEARQLVSETAPELPDDTHMQALAEFYANECGLLPDIGFPDKAIESGLKSLQLRERFHGRDSYEAAKTLNNLGYAYLKSNRIEDARGALQRAYDTAKKLQRENDYAGGNITNLLGYVLLLLGEKDRAFELLTLSIDLPSIGPFESGYRNYTLARYYSDQCDYLKAAKTYSRALRHWRDVQGLRHPDYTECTAHYAEALQNLGKHKEYEKVAAALTKLKAGQHVPPKTMPLIR